MAEGYTIQVGGNSGSLLANANPVEVFERVGGPATFQLTVAAELTDLIDRAIDPGAEVMILVPDGGDYACLVKGLVTSHRVQLSHNDTGVLQVVGADNTIKLDRENKAAVHANTTDSLTVMTVLQANGFAIVDSENTPGQYTDATHALVQRETDLQFIRRLARNHGFLFWVTCDATGLLETAHFKRPPLDASPALDLVINLADPPANVTELVIEWDAERPTSGTAKQRDFINKSDLDGDVAGSPLSRLGSTPLSAIATGTRALHLYAPADDQAALQARVEAALIQHAFFLVARGSTTAVALGGVLRAHTVVNLLGVGSRYSGKWFCSAVKHTVTPTEHRMDFELVRESWGATGL